jgi:hypothetical protein
MPNPGRNRLQALALAVELHSGARISPRATDAVLLTAGQFSRWLDAPPHQLRLRAAPFTFPEGHPGPGVPTRHTEHGGHMSVTITDDQEVTYTVEPEDDKGFAVSDTITWSSDDAGAVLTITPSADGLSAVFAAVAPGSATISATDGTLSASDLVTVTAGAVASLVLTPGTPVAEA